MISQHLVDALDRYVNHGIAPGSFLRACLENNLMDACARADEKNRHALWSIAAYIYNDMPSNCHGSPGVVAGWIAEHMQRKEATP